MRGSSQGVIVELDGIVLNDEGGVCDRDIDLEVSVDGELPFSLLLDERSLLVEGSDRCLRLCSAFRDSALSNGGF